MFSNKLMLYKYPFLLETRHSMSSFFKNVANELKSWTKSLEIHKLLCSVHCDEMFKDLQHILLVCTEFKSVTMKISCSILYENRFALQLC